MMGGDKNGIQKKKCGLKKQHQKSSGCLGNDVAGTQSHDEKEK
ncbi:MAG: hypothetical protein UT77_C0002G0090 [Candidatus Daviesbacteria bacterium GW2011_GWC2_40_12]|uniref:Uncharacterized protein n=1 Tax=Candidatus Daviesbacteria bacterium GW2011_GWC2_40_12 TaxID=1618431 RepID=A0A0G0TWS4_9BACT|nr:MAG: hypothetical protein UT45_C0004G0112 [Candidatus Daviesbacteria bacterium GW2011_GWA2_39_33]KKR42437.1 MAG: hypothetical protein UT77_C0002G0090 [Candidatus Daviesbacteria bacterium GW2011_GWC2_40_12]